MIYAMSDLHLPSALNKTMEPFGWGDHVRKIEKNWSMSNEDTIIIGGDLSWALKTEELSPDLEWLSSLPGKKILIKGNHDLWWNSASKVRKLMSQYRDIKIIQNNSIEVEGISICGTRGWNIVSKGEEDIKIVEREVGRMRLSLQSAICDEKIVFLHYPPVHKEYFEDAFHKLFLEFGVKEVYFGHIHGYDKDFEEAFIGNKDGISYQLTSSNMIDFKPLLIKS